MSDSNGRNQSRAGGFIVDDVAVVTLSFDLHFPALSSFYLSLSLLSFLWLARCFKRKWN